MVYVWETLKINKKHERANVTEGDEAQHRPVACKNQHWAWASMSGETAADGK